MYFSPSIRSPKPTRVFETFWRFAAERQEVFFARLAGNYRPETIDPILRQFKFTNSYRAADRTSQFLIGNVIYGDQEWSPNDCFARILLFKLFNRIDTWRFLENELGTIDAAAIEPELLSPALNKWREAGNPIYSAAYIMPSASQFGSATKHDNHLRLLRKMLDDEVHSQVFEASSLDSAYRVLLAYPSVGPFLAFQFLIDLNYSPHLGFSEKDFVVAGPGAIDGLRICFSDAAGLSDADLIRWTTDLQEEAFRAYFDRAFRDLWGRPLHLVDCQNLFCEVGKYARLAHPEINPPSGRKRIKQRFRPRLESLTAHFPPKWGINEAVKKWMDSKRNEQNGDGAGNAQVVTQLKIWTTNNRSDAREE